MELRSVEPISQEKPTNGSHSLPECWNPQKLRLSQFPYTAKTPSLSTALITSSSDSSDYEEENV